MTTLSKFGRPDSRNAAKPWSGNEKSSVSDAEVSVLGEFGHVPAIHASLAHEADSGADGRIEGCLRAAFIVFAA